MIKDEVFELLPMDSVWGMHNWPGMKVGRAAEHAGPVIAGADGLIFTIELNIRKSFLEQIGAVTRTAAGTTRRVASRGGPVQLFTKYR